MTSTTTTLERVLNGLRQPARLFALDELRGRGSSAPPVGGIYAWYVRPRLPRLDANGHRFQDMLLVYVGIAPSTAKSRSTLRKRLADHTRDDASRSTLRRSVGSVLGIPRDAERPRFSFGARERELSEWLRTNAMVCWVECPAPWTVEKAVIGDLQPPLNMDHNPNGSSVEVLASLRKAR